MDNFFPNEFSWTHSQGQVARGKKWQPAQTRLDKFYCSNKNQSSHNFFWFFCFCFCFTFPYINGKRPTTLTHIKVEYFSEKYFEYSETVSGEADGVYTSEINDRLGIMERIIGSFKKLLIVVTVTFEEGWKWIFGRNNDEEIQTSDVSSSCYDKMIGLHIIYTQQLVLRKYTKAYKYIYKVKQFQREFK